MKNHCGCYKLSAVGLGFAAAVLCALSMVVLGVLNMQYGIGAKMIELVASLYKGYDATWHGIAIGAGYSAAKGFVGGLLFGWVYNICGCCAKKCCGMACKCCGKKCCTCTKPEGMDKSTAA